MWQGRTDGVKPLPRHLMTPERAYCVPIVATLMESPDYCRKVRRMYDPVYQRMKPRLNAFDEKRLQNPSHPEERWEHNMRAARKLLVESGWLEPTSVSGWGWWKLTKRAIEWGEKHKIALIYNEFEGDLPVSF